MLTTRHILLGQQPTNMAGLVRRSGIVLALLAAILIGVLGIGRAVGGASAQDTATHPLIGTWVIDPEVEDPANPPSFDAFMADGTLVNVGSDGASVGSWEPTGPRTATMTFAGLVAGQDGAFFVLRGNLEVDAAGETLTGSHSFTLVAADGTVLAAFQGEGAHGTRIPSQPLEAGGQSLPGFPTWAPATPAASPAA